MWKTRSDHDHFCQKQNGGLVLNHFRANFIEGDERGVDQLTWLEKFINACRLNGKTVLSRALDLALHDRIFVYKNKTVVL